MNWELINSTLSKKEDLSSQQATWAMAEILEGKASSEEIKNFLLGLKSKGESAKEVEALVEQMYQYCAPINISERAVDTVGTGGDGTNTINISTVAAIITNAAGEVCADGWRGEVGGRQRVTNGYMFAGRVQKSE